MSNGKYASYQELRPLQGDISNDLLNQEDQNFKRRAEQREIASTRANQTKAQLDAIEKKKKKDSEDYTEGLDKIKLDSDTGFSSYNEAVIDFYTREGGVLEKYNDVRTILEKDPYNKEALVAERNLFNIAEDINALSTGMVDRMGDLVEGMGSGGYSVSQNKGLFEEFDNKLNKINFKLDIDEKGTLFMSNSPYDRNNDGKVDDADKLTAQNILSTDLLKPVESFNGEEWAKASVDRYGKKTIVNDDGVDKTKIVGFDMSKLKDLKSDVDALFGEDLNGMTDNFKAYAGDTLNVDWGDFTQDKFDEIKSSFAEKVVNAYETTRENSTNVTAKIALEKAEQAKKDKEEKKPEVDIKVMKSTDGKPMITQSANGKTYGFTVTPKEVAVGDKKITIKKLYLADDGTVTYDGTVIEKQPGTIKDGDTLVENPDKGKSKTVEMSGGAINEEDLNEVARGLGYSDAHALKVALEDAKTGKKVDSSNKETITW